MAGVRSPEILLLYSQFFLFLCQQRGPFATLLCQKKKENTSDTVSSNFICVYAYNIHVHELKTHQVYSHHERLAGWFEVVNDVDGRRCTVCSTYEQSYHEFRRFSFL